MRKNVSQLSGWSSGVWSLSTESTDRGWEKFESAGVQTYFVHKETLLEHIQIRKYEIVRVRVAWWYAATGIYGFGSGSIPLTFQSLLPPGQIISANFFFLFLLFSYCFGYDLLYFVVFLT